MMSKIKKNIQNSKTASPALARNHLTGSQDKLMIPLREKSPELEMEMNKTAEDHPSFSVSHPSSPIHFGSENNQTLSLPPPPQFVQPACLLPVSGPTSNAFIPASDFDYLLLGALMEREKAAPKKAHTPTLTMYERQYEDHQKKNAKLMTYLLKARGSTGLSNHNNNNKVKKEKKKPKRPNKVKPQGCEWCHEKSSPVWRTGPSGRGSLCNACGLQWQKGFTIERAKETLRKPRGEWPVPNHH